jgi:eukaryotic-like serine/threonine-protein kinase
MGEVYRAHDTRLNREVALKLLPAAVAHDPDRLRRFEQEARAAAALNHPNILAVFDFGSAGDTPYVISELLEGETLRDRMNGSALPSRKAIDYSLQVAQGLAAAHQKNIAHRDLKPDNLFVTSDGRIKILDFGLAKLMNAGSGSDSATSAPTMELGTSPGMVMGTAGYMSPEQVRGRTVDHRTDIFSLGAVMYEMLTGKRAFLGESQVETLNAILTKDPGDFASTGAQVPAALDQIVRHCLEKSPDERFQSARDLSFALERLTTTTAAPAAAAPRGRRRSFPRWLGMAVAGLACAAAGGIAVGIFQRPAALDQAGFRFIPLANESRTQNGPAWSPDGSTLAYAAVVNGIYQIATRSLGTPTRALITHSATDCYFPFWSPDGGRIYYLALDKGVYTLWAVGAAGGVPEQALANVEAAHILPDGRTFVFIRREHGGMVLYRQAPPEQPVAFRSIVPALGKDAETPYLRVSPDGRQIGIFIASGEGLSVFWVAQVDDRGAARRVLETRRYSRGRETLPFSWMPDSRRILYAGSTVGRLESHVVLADIRSGSRWPVTMGIAHEVSPAVSPDGKRVAFGTEHNDNDVVAMPFDGSAPRPVLATSQSEHCPTWNASGTEFAYSREIGGVDQIWAHNVAENSDRPLITRELFRDGTDRVSEPAYSPDGARIAFLRVANGQFTLWVMSSAGGPPVALSRDPNMQFNPVWSPDGKWIAYCSATTLVKVNAGGGASPVAIKSGATSTFRPRWSARGDWITFMDNSGLSVVSPDGQKSVLLSSAADWSDAGFTRDGNRVAGIRRGPDGQLLLVSIDISTRKETLLTDISRTLPESNAAHGFSLAPDGKSFLTSIGNVKGDIWMIEGFRD